MVDAVQTRVAKILQEVLFVSAHQDIPAMLFPFVQILTNAHDLTLVELALFAETRQVHSLVSAQTVLLQTLTLTLDVMRS